MSSTIVLEALTKSFGGLAVVEPSTCRSR
ncbi:MAG: hypothetical protein RI958_1752, partial [Actinomycetota bacterium]